MAFIALVLYSYPLSASASVVADAKPVYTTTLGTPYTTLFKWDADSVGVLNPVGGRITVIPLRGKGGPTREIRLASGFKSAGGEIYPDVVQRHAGGEIYWLSRSSNRIAVYDSSGKLLRIVPLHSDNYSWFEVRSDRTLIAYYNSNSSDLLGYEEYTAAGKLYARHDPWLRPKKQQNPIARMFFFELAGSARLEVLANYPFVRSTAQPARAMEISCPQISKEVTTLLATLRRDEGLPRPLGTGSGEGELSVMPFILSAARGHANTFYLLANGGTVIRINAVANLAFECWSPPLPPGQFVPSSLAASTTWIAVLTREQSKQGQFVRLRVWNLARQ
ncbi:MAG TPA: hypothetical protein VGQ76_00390 [Thermoanaerobaculia bacterium]|nr:hypothetical protein [Thermoanaerobaculia bacterium]